MFILFVQWNKVFREGLFLLKLADFVRYWFFSYNSWMKQKCVKRRESAFTYMRDKSFIQDL